MKRKTAAEAKNYDESDVLSVLKKLRTLDHNISRLMQPLSREFRESRLSKTISPVLGKAIRGLPLDNIKTDQDLRNVYMKCVLILLYGNVKRILE